MLNRIKEILKYGPTAIGKEAANHIDIFLNRLSSRKQCYICKRTFHHFRKLKGGSKNRSEFHRRLDIIGSDVNNFYCIYCTSHDRERHLFMYFDKLDIWNKLRNSKILYFAPERNLSIKIGKLSPYGCIKADLYPKSEDIQKIDAVKVPFTDDHFDFIIANHILEHIPNFTKALSEFFRTLKPGGLAILQTPYSKALKYNFEDENFDTDELRLFFYGQEDHVRIFGEYEFFNTVKKVGFDLKLIKHQDLFEDHMAFFYGVNRKEDLILAAKPK